MKITPKIYADALYATLKAASAKEIPLILRRFLVLVRQRRHWAHLPAIIRKFDEVASEAEGLIEVSLTTARTHTLAHEREWVKQVLSTLMTLEKRQRIMLDQRHDPTLVGGFTMRVKDFAIDASVKGWLTKLRRNLAITPRV